MIIKIEFEDGNVMLFGDSYKPWSMQVDEYIWWRKEDIPNIKSVLKCNEKWIGWGGLKWCNESEFQHELNREGCQSDDLDNKYPRKYDNFKFVKVGKIILNRVLDINLNATKSRKNKDGK